MQNSMLMFTFSPFDWKYLFGQIWPKNINSQFELKSRPRLIWICRIMQKISCVHFFCFRPEKPFLGKSGQKNQNSLSWNLVPIIWICGIQWCSFFFCWPYPPWVNLVQEFKIVCSKWNLRQRLIRIWKIQWWCLFYLF